MRSILFTIPREVAGWPVFGFGWLLLIWAIVAAVTIIAIVRRHGVGSELWGYLPGMAVVGAVIAWVLPAVSMSEGLAIRGYGVMLFLSIAAGVGLCAYRAWRVGLDPDIILSMAAWLVVAGLVGARLFYVIEYWGDFRRATPWDTLKAVLNVTKGGLVVYGSLIAGGMTMLAFVHKHRLPVLAISDLIAPGVVIGVSLGRIGCFLNGCCHGGVSDLPWAMTFPYNSPPYIEQVERGKLPILGLRFKGWGTAPPVLASVEANSLAAKHGLRAGERIVAVNDEQVKSVAQAEAALREAMSTGEVEVIIADDPQPKHWHVPGPLPRSLPVHPAQIYSFLDALLLCLFLLAYDPFHRRDGELTAIVLTIHPITRFLLEMVRTDETPVFLGLTISQNISLAVFAGGVLLWIYLLRRPLGVTWQRRL